jgi:hypothetical protein
METSKKGSRKKYNEKTENGKKDTKLKDQVNSKKELTEIRINGVRNHRAVQPQRARRMSCSTVDKHCGGL